MLVSEEETGKATGVKLSCLLCDSTFSNESRIAGTQGGACYALKHDDALAHEIALAFLTPFEQPQGLAAADETDGTAQPEEPAEKKRKVQSTVFEFAVTKEQQAQIRQCIGNWFMEASDAMAPHAPEPKSCSNYLVASL